ncbi:Com family DNA-binding transcriptional regulator [Comamonas sp. 4034]|uniref:Com family DNA-binding transcriptional regulator n=1 Tax=Comamonas sp. 4034 TaxID=3156455 RepID=UPI003D1A3A87
MPHMQEVRCANCKRKLAVGVFQQLEIKCPRCGTLNSLRVEHPYAERPGAPFSLTSKKERSNANTSN